MLGTLITSLALHLTGRSKLNYSPYPEFVASCRATLLVLVINNLVATVKIQRKAWDKRNRVVP